MKPIARLFVIALLAVVLHNQLTAISAPPPEAAISLHFSPKGGCVEEVVAQVNAAKRTIFVRAYGFTSPPIGDALIRALGRGVEVNILCDRSERKDEHSQAKACAKAGAAVLFDESHPISHSKVMVIDGKIALVGSYNWTKQAEHNAETLLTINDHDVCKLLLDDFAKHWDHGKK